MYANSNAALLKQYKNDSVMTASPADLIVMLYDALIKNIKLAEIFMSEGSINPYKAHKHLERAQDIVSELMRILDLRFEISNQLLQLYDFMLAELGEINLLKNTEKVPGLIEIISDLRDAWQTVQNGNAGAGYTAIEE